MIKLKHLLTEQSNEKVTIRGTQPYPGTDWDLVHGILGSKRLDDDLVERVSQKLKSSDYRVINIEINSNLQGNNIVTIGTVILKPDSSNPHKVFSTRGSIGPKDGNYETRHDEQVNGLSRRLSDYAKTKRYKGDVDTFGPYTINVEGYAYKQSFFAVS